MGFNDDDSSSTYEDVSSSEELDTSFKKKEKTRRKSAAEAEYKAHKDQEGVTDVDAQMNSLLKLRDAIGMNQDTDTIQKEQALAKKKQAKVEEKRRLSEMSQEDRMQFQASSAHDLMEQVKKKFERNLQLKKQISVGDLETDALAKVVARRGSNDSSEERDIRKEMEELRKKKLARRNKRRPPRTKSSAF